MTRGDSMELNKIYNMDCLVGMGNIPDETIDLVVTDPPYLINYKTGHRQDKAHRFNRVILNDDNEELIKNYIKECHRIMKQNTAMYMFCSSHKVDFFKVELEKYFTIKNMIIWEKNNHTAGDLESSYGRKYEIVFLVNKGNRPFNGKRLTDVWRFDRVSVDAQLHQNQKPTPLISQCIRNHSNEGDVVFDGFMGSGTTAISCHRLNRNFIGFELDKEYHEIAVERHEKEAAQTNIFEFLG
jgi:site-specific DNA-methyltransferase (adenine-specific)